ncbi:MAG TPA: MgtC/SapB family protein [Candidatus Sulfomarinibacteraceae bacterium]|nr:MgtC/SapB family protein [Candidatus Sulfomarinibacteraceae bacterium]
MNILDNLLSVNLDQMLSHLVLLVVAFALALPIGWDREQSRRSFGLRTFPIVAVVSCGFMLLGMQVIDSTDGEARVIQGIITGIGFIGGGAILTNRDSVKGTSSAASIWNTGAIGVAVAFSRFEIAIVLSALNFVTLRLLSGRVKEQIRDGVDGEGRE